MEVEEEQDYADSVSNLHSESDAENEIPASPASSSVQDTVPSVSILERLVRMLPFSMTRTFMLDRWQRSSVNTKQIFSSCGRVHSQTIRTPGLPRQILTQLHAYLCLTLTFLSPQQMDAYGTSQAVTLCKRNTSCASKHTHEGDNKIFLFFLSYRGIIIYSGGGGKATLFFFFFFKT